MFLSGYFGLSRISELAKGTHPILAKNVYIARNKYKFRFVLQTSKTHTQGDEPQVIKLESNIRTGNHFSGMCPYSVLCNYVSLRRSCIHEKEQFFIFRDRAPVLPRHMRAVLKQALEAAKLDPVYYGVHSLRAGRTCDLLLMNFSLSLVKKIGRWKSNAVYNYLRF